jgi:hypothetical protein
MYMHVGKIYADWCGACQQFDPLWQELKLTHGAKHQFSEYNQGDKQGETSITVGKHTIPYEGFPTIFKIDGNKVSQFSGNRDEATFAKWLKSKKHTRRNKKRKGTRRRRK